MPLPPQLAHIDVDPAEIGRHYPPTLGIVADARQALSALLGHLPHDFRTVWAALPPRGEPWSVPGLDALTAFERALPDDAILGVDVTRLAYVLMKEWPPARPRTFLHPSGAVAMPPPSQARIQRGRYVRYWSNTVAMRAESSASRTPCVSPSR